MTSIYDAERLEKIAQIVPQFSKVAEVGDEVMFGLEGDPAFPIKYRGSEANRPIATIVDRQEIDDEVHMTMKLSDGTTKTVTSSTISPNEVWEFTDKSFRSVMERESQKYEQLHRTNDIPKTEYRGTDAETSRMMDTLRAEIDAERANMRAFQNTIITSLQEMAGDILSIDKAVGGGNRAEFSNLFRKEYAKLDPQTTPFRSSQSQPASQPPLKSTPTPPAKPSSKASSSSAYRSTQKPSAPSKTPSKKRASSNIFSDSDSMASQSDSDA